MNCQHCPDTLMVLNDMQGIEVDRCPNCRGVWLDCGELDRIVERSNRGDARVTRHNSNARAEMSDALYTVNAYPTIPRRRKSILGELFNVLIPSHNGLHSP